MTLTAGFEHATYPDLKGKRVLVTAGSAGIGRATALAFGSNGATVTIVARRKERIDAVVEQLPKGKGFGFTADLGKPEDWERLVKEAVQLMGGLDVLVNNGAASSDEMMAKIGTPMGLEAALRMHVSGISAMCEAALPELSKTQGVIVNVSSVAALVPSTEFPEYRVAKAAQDSLTQNLAIKYGAHGVRINTVRPGFTETEVFDMASRYTGKPVETFKQEVARLALLDRVSQPEEQAAAILFLASASAAFITGAALNVDGGHVLKRGGAPVITPAEQVAA